MDRGLTIILGFNGLLQDVDQIKILLLKVNSFALQVCTNDFFLLFDRTRSPINLLQKHLHKIGLAHNEVW